MNNTNQDPFFFPNVKDENEDFNITEVFYKYLAYWKWFLLAFSLALLFAFLYLKTKTPQYSIQTSLLIKDDSKGLDQGDMLKQLDIFSGTKVVDNEIEILKSYNLMEKAVRKLNLQVGYFSKGNFADKELYGDNSPVSIRVIRTTPLSYTESFALEILGNKKISVNGQEFSLDKVINTEFGTLYVSLNKRQTGIKEVTVQIYSVGDITENYLKVFSVEPSSKMSSVLLMSMECAVPQKGIDLMNSLIEEYNKAGLEDKNRVAFNTLAFIDKRLKLVASDLKDVEKDVENFKSREGITDISTESRIFLESVKENDTELNQVKIQESVLASIYQYVSQNRNQGTVPATLGIADPTLLSLVSQLSELEARREQSVKLIKEDNPIILALNDQISNTKKNIKENIQTLQKSLNITRGKLERQNAEKQNLIKTIPGKERALVDITRQQSIKNDIYIFLLQKREETALSYASAVSDSRTIDPARSGNEPVKPVKRNIYLIFALLGLLVPVAVVYILDLIHNKVRHKRDIERVTNVPVLIDISYSPQENPLVINREAKSMLAEQIRALRTNLSFLIPGTGAKSLLFTSSMSGEGKSFVSLNLGASLAMIGKKTVILEMDMRKPKLHAYLKISNNKGISNYLIGDAELKDVLYAVEGQENYYIITCGTVPPNPVELLINGRLQQLFDELKKEFDHIIIDAPPVGMVTDAQVLEKHADATIFLVRHDYTPKDRLKEIDRLFRDGRFKHMNLVYNAVKESGSYGYTYGYGYYS